MGYIQDNAEESVRNMLMQLSEKNNITAVSESEFMDDGSEIHLNLSFNKKERKVLFDFTGTSL
jgi:5-oxoprolinase (ATP-hydrolysing)